MEPTESPSSWVNDHHLVSNEVALKYRAEMYRELWLAAEREIHRLRYETPAEPPRDILEEPL